MKLPLLIPLIFLFPLLTTALLTSAYERMFYWYSYLLDSTLSPTSSRTLAPGCSTTPSVPCTFNQFIGYINNLPTPPSLATISTPDVDSTATLLQMENLAGVTNLERLLPGIGSSAPAAFIRISNLLVSFTNSPSFYTPQSLEFLDLSKKAMSRVQFLRSAAHSDTLIFYLKGWNPGLTIITSVQTYDGDGNVGQFAFLNLAATIKQNPTVNVLQQVTGFDTAGAGAGAGTGGLGMGSDIGALWAGVNVTYC
ncbi:hypothetical protein N431DRAFT_466012 [Stipitochalara longipes BDJ]|nr:hypothetical protein N431DRAFT_466012 [Stipitochalara longipes BDJ]